MEPYRRLRSVFYRLRLLQVLYALPWMKLLWRRVIFSLLDWRPTTYIELTSRCNAACIFCSYPALVASGKAVGRMAPETLEAVLRLVETQHVSKISLTPTTGELLLHPEWHVHLQRVLDLPAVRQVNFYTNAIRLTERARRALLALRGLGKLQLNLSLGGLDRAAYHTLFGVDAFERVSGNVRALLADLHRERVALDVGLEVRLLSAQTSVTVDEAHAVYNPTGYPFAGINLRRKFDRLGGVVHDERLAFIDGPKVDRAPCVALQDTRFAADGSVWACGYAVCEQPGDTSLRLGRFDDTHEVLAATRRGLVRAWLERNTIPAPCVSCAYYLRERNLDRPEPIFRDGDP